MFIKMEQGGYSHIKNIIMKKLLFGLTFIISISSFAQTDSAKQTITVKLPVKAIVLYGTYLSQQPNWEDRKAPDQLQALVGSGTQLDSVVNVTVAAGKLATFVTQLMGDRYGALSAVNRSIFNNTPAITGYTALTTQINTIATGNTSQKAAAIYVINAYNAYTANLSTLYDQMIATGLAWIRS